MGREDYGAAGDPGEDRLVIDLVVARRVVPSPLGVPEFGIVVGARSNLSQSLVGSGGQMKKVLPQ